MIEANGDMESNIKLYIKAPKENRLVETNTTSFYPYLSRVSYSIRCCISKLRFVMKTITFGEGLSYWSLTTWELFITRGLN